MLLSSNPSFTTNTGILQVENLLICLGRGNPRKEIQAPVFDWFIGDKKLGLDVPILLRILLRQLCDETRAKLYVAKIKGRYKNSLSFQFSFLTLSAPFN